MPPPVPIAIPPPPPPPPPPLTLAVEPPLVTANPVLVTDMPDSGAEPPPPALAGFEYWFKSRRNTARFWVNLSRFLVESVGVTSAIKFSKHWLYCCCRCTGTELIIRRRVSK
jgi:hypothetical protein